MSGTWPVAKGALCCRSRSIAGIRARRRSGAGSSCFRRRASVANRNGARRLRNPLARRRVRHPHGATAPRPSRRPDDDDLSPRHEPWRVGRETSLRPPVITGRLQLSAAPAANQHGLRSHARAQRGHVVASEALAAWNSMRAQRGLAADARSPSPTRPARGPHVPIQSAATPYSRGWPRAAQPIAPFPAPASCADLGALQTLADLSTPRGLSRVGCTHCSQRRGCSQPRLTVKRTGPCYDAPTHTDRSGRRSDRCGPLAARSAVRSTSILVRPLNEAIPKSKL